MSSLAQPVQRIRRLPGEQRRVLSVWILALVATLADVATTAFGVGAGLSEGNPVVDAILHAGGIPGFLGFKIGILLTVAAVGARCFDRPTVAPGVLAVAWGSVAVVNVAVIAGV
jgi:hypothetical protein